MDENLLKNIKEDLKKSGFGSELKALKIFGKEGFLTFAGHNYFDKDEGKLREIDIFAMRGTTTKFRDIKYDYYIFDNSYISAEVKKSEKPWVVFKSSYQEETSLRSFQNTLKHIKLNNSNNTILYKELDEKLDIIIRDWNLKVNGVHESFKSPNNASRWYGACLTSIKSIINVFDTNNIDFSESQDEFFNNYYEYQPLVILDGKLISAEMNEQYDIALNEINFARLGVKIESKAYNSKNYYVDIVTLEGLEDYLKMKKRKQEEINSAIMKIEKFDIKKCKKWFD